MTDPKPALSTEIDQAFSAMATDETYQRESEKVRESMDRLSTSWQEIAPDSLKYDFAGELAFVKSAEGRDWARAFVQFNRANPLLGVDEDVMTGWFQQAIDRGKRAHSPAVQALESQWKSKYEALCRTIGRDPNEPLAIGRSD